MYCSKIGGQCPHPIEKDENLIFIIMPFIGFNSIYDIMQQAIISLDGDYYFERADEKYTNLSIWCKRICLNIRRASFIIADTSGKNANVFYELGFAHSLHYKKTIIITQNIEDAPFDIKDIGHILYSAADLPQLRKDLKKALNDLINEPKPVHEIDSEFTYNKKILKDLIKEDLFESAVKDLFHKIKSESVNGIL